MDRGSSLNILYVETFDTMGVSRSKLHTSIFPFIGIIPGMRAYPLGNIELLVTFSNRSNFRTKTQIFEVVDFEESYHAILEHPCYTKFMAVSNYTYLKLKNSTARATGADSTLDRATCQCKRFRPSPSHDLLRSGVSAWSGLLRRLLVASLACSSWWTS
jgi:hypothetical protein